MARRRAKEGCVNQPESNPSKTPLAVSRTAAITLVAVLAVVLTVALVAYGGPLRHGRERVVGYGQIRYKGAGPERWAARYRRVRAQLAQVRLELRHERRVLLSSPNVVEAINLACATYGNC